MSFSVEFGWRWADVSTSLRIEIAMYRETSTDVHTWMIATAIPNERQSLICGTREDNVLARWRWRMLTAKLRRSATTHEVKVTVTGKEMLDPVFYALSAGRVLRFPKYVWDGAQGVPGSRVL